ncbi:rhamnogalacturonan lyase B N-terminal domain-containing protein [Massilia sp. TWP1-3-3]|uniref:rhamnogalacturonan lyase B N-terminal domain-containing protein n=1 Tax=Massilia sp. TWP1-3-3 TaxID=2804573 RepID=UPI003CF5FC37
MDNPIKPTAPQRRWRSACLAACSAMLLAGAAGPLHAQSEQLLAVNASAFGAVAASGIITIDSGAGLVFKVRQSSGDIISIRYNGGPELQLQSKFSHISSGIGAPTTFAVADGVVKLTLTTPTLTHYLLVRQGENTIYMGTYVTAEPAVGELRWITRLNGALVPERPPASNTEGTTGAVESADVFGLPNGETRSKYFGNQRAIDLTLRGVRGPGVGVYMAYGNRESSSGGPFYNDIQFQTAEVYNYMNSGHNQTEAWRTGFHGPYALLFTNGDAPAIPDMGWMGAHNLKGWVGPAGRGEVVGAGLSGMNSAYPYTVAFANAVAQYWTTADPVTGSFSSPAMKAGNYSMTVYKGEYAVLTEPVTVTAGGSTTLDSRSVLADPGNDVALWRIGNWDGTPNEFANGARLRDMHPSDVRQGPWTMGEYRVGTSVAATDFSPYQWKDVNGNITIKFNLRKSQIAPLTLRAGITVAQSGGRPKAQVNGWVAPNPGASNQPNSRSITLGSFRGNNKMYTYNIPANELLVGENTIVLSVISGSGGVQYLSPAYAYDAIDLIKTP